MKVKLCLFVLPLDRFPMTAYLSAPPLTQFVSQINLARSLSHWSTAKKNGLPFTFFKEHFRINISLEGRLKKVYLELMIEAAT